LPLARPIEYIKLIELFIPLEKIAGIIENFWGKKWAIGKKK
jgi:hypothetical protein